MDLGLRGRVAVITGAASGIGRAIAIRFAAEGARMMLVDIQCADTEVLLDTIRQQGGEAALLHCDLSEKARVLEIVPETVRRFDGLDIVVNNAGLFGWANKKPVGDTPTDVWEKTLAVNLHAPFLLSQCALPHMLARGRGAFVNIASIGGLGVFPDFAAYCVSKAALIALTKSIALDYGKLNIRANAICPGAIDTPGNDVFVENRADYLRVIEAVTPMRKPGLPADVAAAAVFLASDEARYITGTTLVVDGGRTASA